MKVFKFLEARYTDRDYFFSFTHNGEKSNFESTSIQGLFKLVVSFLYDNGYKFDDTVKSRRLLKLEEIPKSYKPNSPSQNVFKIPGTDNYILCNFAPKQLIGNLIKMCEDFGIKKQNIETNTINISELSNESDELDTDNDDFDLDKLELENPIKKMNFIEAAKVCLKNNNNQPMSVNDIWDNIKGYVSYTTETPLNSLASILGRFSENSNLTRKAKNPIFRRVSENPNKYVLIDPNNIQETEDDDSNKTGYESETPETGTEAQYLSFWNEFTRRLSQFTKRFDGRRRNRKHWLSTPTDVKSINYVCVIRRDRADLEVYFYSKSPIYYKLLKLRSQIEKEFGNSLEWIDNQQKKYCKIIFVKIFGQSFPKNREELMNFFLENFPKFENVFNKYLKSIDNTPEDPTDTKISKFSDWTSSYPNVSPQYKYPNPTTKITSEPQKFTSYLTPIDKFLDPNSPKPETDIERPKIFAVNPFRQAICVFGESGAGKSTTVEKILKKEGHQIVKIMPSASTNGLVINFEPSKSKYVPGYFGKLLIVASQNPEKLYTAFFDEMHKTNVIDMINDELLQAISLMRNRGIRFVTLDPENSLMFSKTSLLDEDSGVIYVPDNVGFIFITSKPKVIANNPDFFKRVDLVKIEGEEDWKKIQTSQDLINNIISTEEKKTFSSIRND